MGLLASPEAPAIGQFGRHLLLVVSVAIGLLTLLSLYRAVIGPRSQDRLVAVNVINTKTVLMLALVAHMSGQFSFVDVALAYALTSFVTTVAVLKAVLKGRLF